MNYNTVKSVDALIESLEKQNVHSSNGKNKDLDKAITERNKKLEKLKKLREELDSYETYGKSLEEVKKSNETLDDAINDIEITLGKKQRTPRYQSYSYGESRCGESNW